MRDQRSAVHSSRFAGPDVAEWLRDPANIALAAACIAWAVGLAMVLTHPIFVTNDSLNNYAHVWYVSDRIYHGHGVPLHIPVLAHGDAYAFPYGFVPWFTAALVRPLFGDWTVTLWLVLGFLGTVAAMWWAFPELRSGWWFALLLIEPMLVESPLLGQLPFLWAAAMLFAAMKCWRRSRFVAAAILCGLSQATHPAVMVPIVAVLVAARLYWEPSRPKLLLAYAASLVIAAPAIWLTLASPSVGDSSRTTLLGNFFGTVSLRAIVIAAPFIGLALQRITSFMSRRARTSSMPETSTSQHPTSNLALGDRPPSAVMALLFAGLIALNIVLIPIRHNQFGWTALTRDDDTSFEAFFSTPAFTPGATYRLLRVGDGKVGMYQMIQHGALLDSEFFPESIDRRSWPDAQQYADFLQKRQVDYVVVFNNYDVRYRTNEHNLLEVLSSNLADSTLCASRVQHTPAYDVYRTSACANVRGPGPRLR